jgi:hypothetical protein
MQRLTMISSYLYNFQPTNFEFIPSIFSVMNVQVLIPSSFSVMNVQVLICEVSKLSLNQSYFILVTRWEDQREINSYDNHDHRNVFEKLNSLCSVAWLDYCLHYNVVSVATIKKHLNLVPLSAKYSTISKCPL